MDLLSIILLGIFQGLFEWLPVSSEGISIYLMVNILQINPSPALSYAVFLHFGTMLAVLVKFRSDFLHMVRSITSTCTHTLKVVILATIFTGVTAVPLMLVFEGFSSGRVVNALIGCMLVITGVILRIPKSGKRSINDMSLLESTVLGLVQGLAILPGISRSGVTVSYLLMRKINEEDALKLSFIISVPAVMGAVILKGIPGDMDLLSAICMVIVSFSVGYATIDVLMRYARKVNFSVFCITFGMLAILTSVLLSIHV